MMQCSEAQIVKKLPACYETRRFMTVFVGAATGSYPEPIFRDIKCKTKSIYYA
jgi:hypothetical protein